MSLDDDSTPDDADLRRMRDGIRARLRWPDHPDDPGPQPDGTVLEPLPIPFRSWEPIDPLTLECRRFVYGSHYIRKFASATIAPPGLGKSSLVMTECIAIATGLPLLGIKPPARERVVYFNAEDPFEEIQRRVLAICQHYGVPQEELVDWFYPASGRDTELNLAEGEAGTIAEPVFEMMGRFAAMVQPAVFAFDPLANVTSSPETNEVFRRLSRRLSSFADAHNCSIEVVHHTRKLGGREAEIEDSRGGSALLGAVRAGRVINPMSPEEAARAGLDTHIDHFRIEAAGKNNLARAAAHAQWFRRVSIELPNGDDVAVVEAWDWPDAFAGVSTDDARRVQRAIGAKTDDPPRESIQSKTWAGFVVAQVLGLDVEQKADKVRIQTMLKRWIKTGVLEVVEAHSARDGRDVRVVIRGPNNLSEEAAA